MEKGENKKKPESEKDEIQIPVLRTLQNDFLKKASETGDSGVRKILVSEAEKQKKAEAEYRDKVKDVFKDSAMLSEKKEKFKSKNLNQSVHEQREAIIKERDKKAIDRLVSGTGMSILSNQDPSKDNANEKNENENYKRLQEEIVAKNELIKSQRELDAKKEKIREMAGDLKTKKDFKTSVKDTYLVKNILLTFVAVCVLIAFIFIIYILLIRENSSQVVIPEEQATEEKDVIIFENKRLFNIDEEDAVWRQTFEAAKENNTLTKFIPFSVQGERNLQVEKNELFSRFDVLLPSGFVVLLNNYYFLGEYKSESDSIGVFISTIENQGDALVWLLKFGNLIPKAFLDLFPTLLNPTNENRLSSTPKVIDNKEIYVLENKDDNVKVLYYFFNREILVILVGDGEEIITEINRRIRLANSI